MIVYKILQHPTEISFLAKSYGSQLELQTDIVNRIMSSANSCNPEADLPVAIICAVGQPSTRKTAYINAVWRQLQSGGPAISGGEEMKDFPEPGNVKQVDGQEFDGILVSTPLLLLEDNGGRRVGVITLDVWNKAIMSEDDYMKLMDFGFHASTIRIFTLETPLRETPWWVGDYSCISSEPKTERHWLTIINQLTEHHGDIETSGSYLIALNGQVSVWKLLQSVHNVDKGSLDICPSGFEFIMELIFSPEHETLSCKLSDLEDHFKNWLDDVRSSELTVPPPELPIQEEAQFDALTTQMDVDPPVTMSLHSSPSQKEFITTPVEPQALSADLVATFTDCVYDAYLKSPRLCLSSEEFLQPLAQLQSQSNNMDLSSQLHFEHLRKFYETLHASQRATNTEIAQLLEDISAKVENAFELAKKKESCKAPECIQYYRTKADWIARNVAVARATSLQLSEMHLPRERGLFIFKLSTQLQRDIKDCMESLEQQIKLCQNTLAQYKDALRLKLSSAVCISEDNFEEAVRHSRESIAQMVGKNLRPALKTAVERAAQNYEERRRLANRQVFIAEFHFAQQALPGGIHVIQKHLTDYLREHKVMTARELSDAFDSICRNVTKARRSVPEFRFNDAWEAAWNDLQPSVEKCFSQLHRHYLNVIRKWDREMNSAIEKSTLLYNQEMDRHLPEFKILADELDKVHSECAQHTLENFTVSSQVNEETKNYWKCVLELSKLQEWKEGYVILNNKKKSAPPAAETAAAFNYEKIPAKLSNLVECHVGIYFGPEVVILTPLISNSGSPQEPSDISIDFPLTLEIKPYLAISCGKIIYGEQALDTKNPSGRLFNIFSILAKLPEPAKSSSFMEEINGHKVSLTPEAVAVLYFREVINHLSDITGRRVNTCTVTHPETMHCAAVTVLAEVIKIAGFSKVNLIPITTSLALSYVHPLLEGNREIAKKPKQFVAVYQAGEILEISLIQLAGSALELKSLKGFSELGPELKKPENLTKLMRKYFEKLAPEDLFATVLMLENEDEDNALVRDTLIKVAGDLNCPHNIVECSTGMSKTVAEIDAGKLSSNDQPYQNFLPASSTGLQLLSSRDPAAANDLKAQVVYLVKLMNTHGTRTSPKTKNMTNETIQETSSPRCQLTELVKQVEEALGKSSTSVGPLSTYINQSVKECHQLLLIPTTDEKQLTMALKKLQIRSEDLLKESNLS